jgi:flagellin-like protein
MRKIKKKKGVSPVVASLLLVVIVIILSMIIFIWAKSFIKEVIQKKDKPATQVCSEIRLQATYSPDDGEVLISNIGNYPVHALELRLKSGARTKIYKVEKSFPLGAGEIIKDNALKDYQDIEVVPIILGENSKRKQTQYTCKDDTILAEKI